MRAIEQIGLTKEAFKELYEQYNGFDDQFNKNHPTYNSDESFMQFLSAGSRKLISEDKDLVKDIIKAEEEQNGDCRGKR